MDTHGYIENTPVYDKFWTFSNPHYQRYIALSQGHVPTMHDDFVYIELGCGNALALCINAAANPKATFIGIDFMPEYVALAQKNVERMGLTNVEIIEADITAPLGESRQRIAAIPEADFVFAHGFIAWVSPEVQTAAYEFIGSNLRPGGIAFTSYDSLPGSKHREIIHHLALSYKDTIPDATDRVQAAFTFVNFLYQNKSAFTGQNESVVKDLISAVGQPEAAAHLFGNESYSPLWFADVSKEMNTQGLFYCGSTTAANNNPSLVLPEAALKALTFPDIETLEFVKDMFSNMEFRSDLYIRPMQTETVAGEILSNMKFTLAAPRDLAVTSNDVRVGKVSLQEDLANAALDSLVDGEILSNLNAEIFHNLVAISLAIAPQVDTTLDGFDNRAFIDCQLENYKSGHVAVVSSVLGSGAILPVESVLLYVCGSHGAAQKWLDAHRHVPIDRDRLAEAVKRRDIYKKLIEKLVPEL
jgi:predicted O-methyltransferase YrrM